MYIQNTSWYHQKTTKNTNIKRETILQGVWRQYDEQMILWSPWWTYGRDGGTLANCAVIDLSEDTNAGDWEDDLCTSAHRYICERD